MQSLAKFFGFAGGLLVVVGILLVSCSPDTTAPTLQFQPTNAPPSVAVVAESTDISSVMTSVPPFTDMACLDCHTDQPALVELALPEEEAESALSSGPG